MRLIKEVPQTPKRAIIQTVAKQLQSVIKLKSERYRKKARDRDALVALKGNPENWYVPASSAFFSFASLTAPEIDIR